MKGKQMNDFRFLNLIAIIGAAFILTIEVWNLYSVNRSNNYAAWISHTHEVIENSNELLSNIAITESWARGYAATREASFLHSYYQSKEQIMPVLNQLKQLAFDDREQQSRIDTLTTLAMNRMAHLDETISAATDSELSYNALTQQMTEGGRISALFREANQRLKDREQQLLQERLISLENEYRNFRTLIIITSSLSLTVLLVLYIFLLRQMERRMKTEKELFISREWFSKTLASLGDGVIATDISGLITFLNFTAQQLTGWNEKDALGKPLDFVFDLVNESTGLPEENPVKKAMQEKQIVLMANHAVLISKDKSHRFIDDSAAPILNDYGELVGAVLIFRDITDKVEFRKKLIESENRLRKIIENSSTVITIRDKEGRFTLVNKAFEKLTGCTEEELIGRKHIPTLTRGARINEFSSILKPMETDSVITSEEEWMTHDGSMRYFVAVRFPIKDAAGKITGVGAVCTDITEQKLQLESRHEKLLRMQMEESESHYKSLANSISEMFFSIDRNDRFLFWNHACEKQTGKHEEDVIGKRMDDIFPGAEFQYLKEKFHHAIREQAAEIFKSEFRSNGTTQNFVVHVYTSPHGISVLMQDVTAQRKTEQEAMKLVESLQQKNKDLRQFAYIISHNLRAPIAKIQGLADLFNTDTESDEINTKIIENITRELKGLDQIVNDLTDIISIREIEYKSKELVSLHDELEQARIILSEEIKASGAAIIEDFSEVPSVNSIKSYLHSILINLISNAIKFHAPQRCPEIRVTSRKHEQFTVISVQDNGLGINMAKHGSKLFSLYKRFHNHVEGRGMGLYLVKNQVESLGGRIEAESQLNEGTTFRVYLPADNYLTYEKTI